MQMADMKVALIVRLPKNDKDGIVCSIQNGKAEVLWLDGKVTFHKPEELVKAGF